jgi:hypothetical protein
MNTFTSTKNKIMKRIIPTLAIVGFVLLSACTSEKKIDKQQIQEPVKTAQKIKTNEPHQYGGWYCPDNLFGFPALDINNWQTAPVIKNRLATKEEVQTEAALIYIDRNKYPNAKAIKNDLPKLATYNNPYSKRKDIIIVIETISVQEDSIAGFRFLNGGNGSAHLRDIHFLSEEEINQLPKGKFFAHKISINTPQKNIWNVLTNDAFWKSFQKNSNPIDAEEAEKRKNTNFNFIYNKAGKNASRYGTKLFGNYYIQNDYLENNYTEKVLVLENEDTKSSEMIMLFGPFGVDYPKLEKTLTEWSKEVKRLSELSLYSPYNK